MLAEGSYSRKELVRRAKQRHLCGTPVNEYIKKGEGDRLRREGIGEQGRKNLS